MSCEGSKPDGDMLRWITDSTSSMESVQDFEEVKTPKRELSTLFSQRMV
jgi:hypothetical protein